MLRIALANLPYPSYPDEGVVMAQEAVREAGERGARIVAFPECFLPGYRTKTRRPPVVDRGFLESAWDRVSHAARDAKVAVLLGTERFEGSALRISTLVIGPDGQRLGFQDKVQLDPSEEGTYAAGNSRRVFRVDDVTFGVAICHEGWRYPETVRWAARHGAQIVFLPQFHEAGPGTLSPTSYGDPRNTFHENAVRCRAAENTCYVATINYAGEGSPTTSAVADPDGRIQCFQPYGRAGLLIADLDLARSTRLLATRLRADSYGDAR